MNDLYNLLQNLHPKIEFTVGHNFKELPFLDTPLMKITKLAQVFTTNPQAPVNTSNSKPTTPKTA